MDGRDAFWKLAAPAAMEGLLLMLLSAVDLFMVSSLGTLSVAAVSISGQPRMVVLCFSRSLAVAVTAYVARLNGEQEGGCFSDCAKQSFAISLAIAVCLLGITIGVCKPILIFAGADSSYLPLAVDYAVPAFISLFLLAPSIVLNAVLAGLGDTRSGLLANVMGNVVNVCCNFLFIYGVGPFPKLGVAGAGIGTMIGAAVTFAITFFVCIGKDHPASLRGIHGWLPTRSYLRYLFWSGRSVLAEQSVERVGMFAYSRMVAELGASALGIHNICMGLCDIHWSFAQGMGKAGLILAGNDLGATKGENIGRISKVVIKESLWTAALACAGCVVFRKELLGIYHLEGNELLLGVQIMIFVAIVSFPQALAMNCSGILRGMGYMGFVAKYSLISIAVLRPILTFVLIFPLNLGLHGAWLALVFDQSLRTLFAICKIRSLCTAVSHFKTNT